MLNYCVYVNILLSLRSIFNINIKPPFFIMLHWKAIFIILSIVFGVIGFIGIGDGPIEPAQFVFAIFLVLLMSLWVFDFVGKKRKRRL